MKIARIGFILLLADASSMRRCAAIYRERGTVNIAANIASDKHETQE